MILYLAGPSPCRLNLNSSPVKPENAVQCTLNQEVNFSRSTKSLDLVQCVVHKNELDLPVKLTFLKKFNKVSPLMEVILSQSPMKLGPHSFACISLGGKRNILKRKKKMVEKKAFSYLKACAKAMTASLTN